MEPFVQALMARRRRRRLPAGDYDEALRIRQEIELPVYERLGDTRSAAVAWCDIADIAYQRGDYDARHAVAA